MRFILCFSSFKFFYVAFFLVVITVFPNAYGEDDPKPKDKDKSSSSCGGDFTATNQCIVETLEDMCKDYDDSGGENKSQTRSKTKGSTTCSDANTSTTECCQDPTTCLGGEALSMLKSINSVATQVGPGVAMGAQGFGKDMGKLCKTMQWMAGAGASLSLAASGRCKASIVICRSTCNSEIALNCQKYRSFKIPHNQVMSGSTECAHQPEITGIGQKICNIKKMKKNCSIQESKSDEMMQNMTQMATSAMSSEMCKMQARLNRNKEQCKKAGGEFVDGECIMPEDKCKGQDGEWNAETKKCTPKTQIVQIGPIHDPALNPSPQTTGGDRRTTETPDDRPETQRPDDESEGDPDTPQPQTTGGGGRERPPAQPGSIGSISMPGGSLTSDQWTGDNSQKETNPSSSGRKYSGFNGSGFRANPGYFKRKKSGRGNSDGNISMGGGGFAGYGGGEGDDGQDDYANLGLNKKQLKEIENKKGASRVSASESGGTHQSIFERISKRFQSLCKNKLDCR